MDWFLPWTPGGPAPALLLSCKTVATSIGMNLSGKFELLNVNCMELCCMHKCGAQIKAKTEIVSGKSYGTLLGPLCAQIFEGGGV